MVKGIMSFTILAVPFIAIFIWTAINYWLFAVALVGAIVFYGLCIWAVHVIGAD